MSDKPMCEAVVLLLKRMESNPEEFYSGLNQPQKWRNIEANVSRYAAKDSHDLTYLEPHELDALWNKLRDIKKTQLHHDVMERILNATDSTYIPPPGAWNEVGSPFRTEQYARGFKVSTTELATGGGGGTTLGEMLKNKLAKL